MSTNVSGGFAARTPEQFVPHAGVVTLQASESSIALIRAVRAGDMAQRCIANQQRAEAAKDAWAVQYLQPRGAPLNLAEISRFTDGEFLKCPISDGFYYGNIGIASGCEHPGHSR